MHDQLPEIDIRPQVPSFHNSSYSQHPPVAVILRVSRGPVLITVPAHPYLWTDSDKILCHQCRYTRAMLTELISSGGETVEKMALFGAIPGQMIPLFKLLKPSGGKTVENQKPLAARVKWTGWLDVILYAASNLELVISTGVSFLGASAGGCLCTSILDAVP